MSTQTIGFIGAGNMASSIIGGLLATGFDTSRILASDPDQPQRELLEDKFSIQCFENNQDVVNAVSVVVLAIKPQKMKQAIESINQALVKNQPLIISIAAGLRISDMIHWIGAQLPLIRVMPNTPALVNSGVSGMFANALASPEQKNMAQTIMQSVGPVVWVDCEQDIDTVTGISGSGPAYYFKLMEIMIDTAMAQGLSAEAAKTLVLNTALGAAKLAVSSDHPPSELRRQVTSPGGTTEAALLSMEQNGIDATIDQGIKAAIKRSDELAKTIGES